MRPDTGRFLAAASLALAVALGSAGLGAAEEQSPPTAPSGTSGAPKTAGGPSDAGKGSLATINGVPITRDEFALEVEHLPEQYRKLAESAEGRRQILDNLIIKRLLYARARDQGLDRDRQVRAQVEAYAQQAAVDVLVTRIAEKAAAGVTDPEVRQYYDAHAGELKRPERVRASHILVEDEAEGNRLRAELAAGKDFAELAKSASKDKASAEKGGDLGFFTRERMVPEFADAAFALKRVGDLSPVVKSQFGYHVIKLTDRKPAETAPYAEVKDRLEAKLREEKQQSAVDSLISDVRGKAKIEVNEAGLAD